MFRSLLSERVALVFVAGYVESATSASLKEDLNSGAADRSAAKEQRLCAVL